MSDCTQIGQVVVCCNGSFFHVNPVAQRLILVVLGHQNFLRLLFLERRETLQHIALINEVVLLLGRFMASELDWAGVAPG
jgi:hypothetical protein